jgi:hypothetical protein
MRIFCAATALILSCVKASGDPSSCRDVLVYAGRNITTQQADEYILQNSYDKYCDNKKKRTDIKYSSYIEAVVEAIPLKNKSAAAYASDKLSQFCQSAGDEMERSRSYKFAADTASLDAVNAWQRCVEFTAKNKVRIDLQQKSTLMVLDIVKESSNPVTITRLESQGGAMCSAPDDVSIEKPVPTIKFSKKTINDDRAWQLVCTRDPNSNVYPESLIVVGTSTGSMLVKWQADHAIQSNLASEIQNQITDLRNIVDRHDKMLGMIGELNYNTTSPFDECIKIGQTQICFGRVDTAFEKDIVSSNGAMRGYNISFRRPFGAQPVITFSLGPLETVSNGDTASPVRLAAKGFDGFRLETHNRADRNYTPPVTLYYIAIGKAR